MIALDRLGGRRALLLLGMAFIAAAIAGWSGLDRLGQQRHRLAMLEMMAATGARAPVPLLPVGLAHTGRERRGAEMRFGRQLTQAAAGHRLLIERIETLPVSNDRPRLLAADIALSGSEDDILRFARAIEGSRPLIRFAAWRIARTAPAEATIRIEAHAIALWDPAP